MYGIRRSRINDVRMGILNHLHYFPSIRGFTDNFDVFFER